MAKRKTSDDDLPVEFLDEPEQEVVSETKEAPFFSEMIDEVQKKQLAAAKKAKKDPRTVGIVGFAGEQMDEMLVGIPLYPLCLRYLFDCDVVPLHRLVNIFGFYQSAKSTMAFELAKWVLAVGGVAAVIDTEQKFSPSLYKSLVGEDGYRRSALLEAETIEEAEARMTDAINFLRRKDPDDRVVKIVILDSISGSGGQESSEKIKEQGFADGRGYDAMAAAGSLTKYFKRLSSDSLNMSVIFVTTNHMKERTKKVGQTTIIEKYHPGASAQDFHANWNLEMSRKGDLKEVEGGGYRELFMKVEKNSSSFSSRSIQTRVNYWRDPDTQEQTTWFDWEGATVDLLISRQTKYGLNKIIVISKDGSLYTCKQVKAKRVTKEELGRMIHEDAEMMEVLTRQHFRIKRQTVWESHPINQE